MLIYFLFIVWPIYVKIKFTNRFGLQDKSLFLYPLLHNISLMQPRKIIESTARTGQLLLLVLPSELNKLLLLKLVPAFCKLKFAQYLLLLLLQLTQREDNHRAKQINITFRPITLPLNIFYHLFIKSKSSICKKNRVIKITLQKQL